MLVMSLLQMLHMARTVPTHGRVLAAAAELRQRCHSSACSALLDAGTGTHRSIARTAQIEDKDPAGCCGKHAGSELLLMSCASGSIAAPAARCLMAASSPEQMLQCLCCRRNHLWVLAAADEPRQPCRSAWSPPLDAWRLSHPAHCLASFWPDPWPGARALRSSAARDRAGAGPQAGPI
jgi:hypothetical protein